MAHKYAPALAADQLDDVVQQTFLLLHQADGRGYSPDRGEPLTYILMIARRAAREVAAQYAPPGRRTRPPTKRDRAKVDRYRRQSDVVSFEDLIHSGEYLEDLVDVADARLDADLILNRAPPAVSHCLRRICVDDLSIAQAAAEIKLSRFALERKINKLRASLAA